jgi:hypothetical protein
MRWSYRVALVLLAIPAAARADDPTVKVGAVVDLRYARTDDQRSFLDRGPGKLRYGAGVNGAANLMRLSQLSLLVKAEISPVVSAFVQLNVDAEPDEAGLRSRADLITAYLGYRPELTPHIRLRFRAGAFFPPISLENTGPAWTSRYSITGSAANSWIGEELKAVGVEGSFVLKGDQDELALTGAAIGSNDPTGTLLGWRGWTLQDRQTGFGDRLAYPPVPGSAPGGPFEKNAPWVEPMVEVDGRVGWYAGATVAHSGVFEARALRYDNRADQTAFDGWQYAWMTRFSAFGIRLELPAKAELIGQHIQGDTHMGRTPGGDEAVVAPFQTTFGLVSVPVGRHRLSVRYDHFKTDDHDVLSVLDPNQEHGSAWTGCYMFEPTEHQRLAVEVIRVDSERAVRPAQGFPLRIVETLVQASWRLAF